MWKIQLSSKDTASGGSQKKNFVDGFWFKADTLGFESFAEVLSYYVNKAYGYRTLKYEIGYINAGIRQLVGVKSKDYSKGGEIFCLEDFLMKKNKAEYEILFQERDPSVKFALLCKMTDQYTGLHSRCYYLNLFMTDFINGNPDRHLSNIDIIYTDGSYHLAPYFDYGLSWYVQDDVEEINEQNVSEAVESISFRPFNMIGTEFYRFLIREGARKPKLLVDPQQLYNRVYSMQGFYDESFIKSRVLLLQTRIAYIEYLEKNI